LKVIHQAALVHEADWRIAMNSADFLVAYLAAQGVTHIFGYPGSPLVPLLAAIERQSTVRWVLMRHENAAALAASAHAKLTGRLGVCVGTSGPGALNLVGGVMDAQLDRAPVLALTGLIAAEQQGHWDFQDIDQTALFRSVAGQSVTAVDPIQLVALLRGAVGRAIHCHEAVHLALPTNILQAEIDDLRAWNALDPGHLPALLPPAPPSEVVLDAVAEELDRRQNIVIAVGRRAAYCGAALEALACHIQAPIITSLDGKGIVDESHPSARGVLGIFGFPAVESAKQCVRQADVILAFGVEDLKPFLAEAADEQRRILIQCEPDASLTTRDYTCSHVVTGPLDRIAAGLRERTRARPPMFAAREPPSLHTSNGGLTAVPSTPAPAFVHPQHVLNRLNRYLDERCTIALDTGAHTLWAAHALQLRRHQRVLVSNRLGMMGFSLPAAIAAQLAQPDHWVIAICGDGGLQMVLGELATAAQERLPITVIVFNNGLLHNVAAQQVSPYGTALGNPDFVALARAFGADGAVVDGSTDVDTVLRRAAEQRSAPFLVDVRCDPSIPPPLSRWEETPAPAGVMRADARDSVLVPAREGARRAVFVRSDVLELAGPSK
jgi:thiamine pyrophosphate-dependent acetolactate synthase large subunit-like protein